LLDGQLKHSLALIKGSLGWQPIKFHGGPGGPRLLALYIQARLTPQENIGYWTPLETSRDSKWVEVATALMPSSQGHWFYVQEAKGKNAWRSGANGNRIFQDESHAAQACMALVFATPKVDENGQFVPTPEDEMELQILRIVQPTGARWPSMCSRCSRTRLAGTSQTSHSLVSGRAFLKAIPKGDELASIILAPISHAKVPYVVQDPRDAVDFRSSDDSMGQWSDLKTMNFKKVDNVIVLSEAHRGKVLTHWNLDLVPGYGHNVIYDHPTC
jgi:hypothetical protein